MRYFPDESFDDSLQEPLKELDFNDSTGSYAPPSKSKRASRCEPELSTRHDRFNPERRCDNKENRMTDADKLPVYHRGPHGEQLGTLIVRHHAQKDSKCIQCRNCGIFFTVALFLKHCHDQYGKRSECNGVHLQLGLDRPTSQQREAWGAFQKKMLSDGKERITVNSEPTWVRNGRLSEQNISRSKQLDNPINQRIRRSNVDLSFKRAPTQLTPSFKVDNSSLLRSKEFLSSTGLRSSTHPNSLSLSQLNPGGTYNAQRDSDISREKKNAVDWLRNADNLMNRIPSWSKTDNTNTSSMRAASLNRPNVSDATNNMIRDTNTSLWDVPTRETTTAELSKDARLWDVPDMTSDDSFPHTKPIRSSSIEDSIEPAVARPLSPRIHECKGIDRAYESSVIDILPNDKCTDDLIKSAIAMLEKASLKIKKDNGNNSNAWRKMYEEERDHRMKLEAKVRDLERELRLKS